MLYQTTGTRTSLKQRSVRYLIVRQLTVTLMKQEMVRIKKNSRSYDSKVDPVPSVAYSSESDPINSLFDDEVLENIITTNQSFEPETVAEILGNEKYKVFVLEQDEAFSEDIDEDTNFMVLINVAGDRKGIPCEQSTADISTLTHDVLSPSIPTFAFEKDLNVDNAPALAMDFPIESVDVISKADHAITVCDECKDQIKVLQIPADVECYCIYDTQGQEHESDNSINAHVSEEEAVIDYAVIETLDDEIVDEIQSRDQEMNPSIPSLVVTKDVDDDYVDTSPFLGSTSPKQSDVALSEGHGVKTDCDKYGDQPSNVVEPVSVNQTLEGDKNDCLGNDPNPSIEDDDESSDDVVFLKADADIDKRSDLLRDIAASATASLALDDDLQSPEHVNDDKACESFEAATVTGIDRYAVLFGDNTKVASFEEKTVTDVDKYTVAFDGNGKNLPCEESLSASGFYASFDATTVTTSNHDNTATSIKVVSFEEVFCSPSMATATYVITKTFPDSLPSSFSIQSRISNSSDSSKWIGATMDRYADVPTTPRRSVSSFTTKHSELMKSQVMECSEKFQPRIFQYSNGCERCLSLLSDHERAKYEQNRNSPLVTITSGGCHESCQFFQGIHGKGGVRLCMRCFQSLHKPLLDTLKVRDEGICDRSRLVSRSRSSPMRSDSRGRSASRGRGIME